jgi:hypothetical protein
MSLKTLAEAIILQSAEDIMDERFQAESVKFLGGEGFRLCSKIAGMDHSSQCKFLNSAIWRLTEHRSSLRHDNAFVQQYK